MAEKKDESSPVPLVQANNNHAAQSDEESVAAQTKDKDLSRKKKGTKCIAYIVAFSVFQTAIILAFVLVFMRIKNPKFRVRSASFDDAAFKTATGANSSFNFRMNAQFTVKNTNFGHFKYDDGFVTFEYRGTPIGQASIEKARAKARSTKKVNATVVLSSSNLTDSSMLLRSDISSGILQLTSYSKLGGKIHLIKVFKKKKSAQMNCSMEVVIATKTLQNVVCK